MLKYKALEQSFEQYTVLKSITSILEWDTSVNLHVGSNLARARQIQCIEETIISLLRRNDLATLFHLVPTALNKWQVRNLELMRDIKREYDIYPENLLKSLALARVRCEAEWKKACELDNFAVVQNSLEVLFELIKEKADIRGATYSKSPYGAMVDLYSAGLNLITVDSLFDDLSRRLPELRESINGRVDNNIAPDPEKCGAEVFQRIASQLMMQMQFNSDKGRVDYSKHPFCGGYPDDVRITHHYTGNNFVSAIYAVLHEVGHGVYLQNLPQQWLYQPVGQFMGYAAHEASALLYEFFIGHSEYFIKRLGGIISKSMPNYSMAHIKQWANSVRVANTSRIDADMVTYPLHVILRYEVEKKLFDRTIKIKDVPEFWRERHKAIFGFPIHSDLQGCLQDTHWYIGHFGYFPSYVIGLLYAAQLYYKFDFDNIASEGEWNQKHKNLCVEFYNYGSLYDFENLVVQSTREPLSPLHYYKFIQQKFF